MRTHAIVWPAITTEIPESVAGVTLIGRGDGCVTWVESLLLHSCCVVVRARLLARPEQGGEISLVDGGFDSDGPPTIRTIITTDGDVWDTQDGSLEHGGADGSSGGVASADWWLPTVPETRIVIRSTWTERDLDGSVEFDASTWRERAAGVTRVF